MGGFLGLAGSLVGVLGSKWARKVKKMQATAGALEQLANIGDETEPLALISELQPTVKGKSGDEFTLVRAVWRKTKQGRT
jgi:hypothetical protein